MAINPLTSSLNAPLSGTGASASGQVRAHGHRHGGRQQVVADAATALDMSTTDLATQLQSGKSIAEIAKAQGMTIDTLKSKMTDAFNSRLQSQVVGGTMNQPQAANIAARFSANLDTMLSRTASNGPVASSAGGAGGRGADKDGDNDGR
jgi:hypothetical protein